jgi:hypothetical protein
VIKKHHKAFAKDVNAEKVNFVHVNEHKRGNKFAKNHFAKLENF